MVASSTAASMACSFAVFFSAGVYVPCVSLSNLSWTEEMAWGWSHNAILDVRVMFKLVRHSNGIVLDQFLRD